jgi:DNA-binding MarR family transcriptional regulator
VPISKSPDVAGRLRATIAQIDRLLSREGTGGDLTRTQVSILFALVRHGELRLSDLAEREGINPTMLSRVVASLESAGLVRRAPDPRDRRAALVTATPAAAEIHDRLKRERGQVIAAYLAGLAPEQVAQLAAALPLLEGLADHLRARGAPAASAGGTRRP